MKEQNSFEQALSGIKQIVDTECKNNQNGFKAVGKRKTLAKRRFYNTVNIDVSDLIRDFKTDLSENEITELQLIKETLVENILESLD